MCLIIYFFGIGHVIQTGTSILGASFLMLARMFINQFISFGGEYKLKLNFSINILLHKIPIGLDNVQQ